MNVVLDFPPLPDVAEPARSAVAIAATAAMGLTKLDLTDVALSQFGEWRTDVELSRQRLANVAWDLTTTKGFADIKVQRNTLTKVPRAEANKIADSLVSKLTAVNKAVRAEQKLIVEAWDAMGAPLTVLIDARQAELDEEARVAAAASAEAECIEVARIAAHQTALAELRAYPKKAESATSTKIGHAIVFMQAKTIGDAWQEFAGQAEAAKQDAIVTLTAMRNRAAQEETEAAERERHRQENARVAAELEAQRVALAAQAAALAAQAAALKAQQDAAEKEARDREAAAKALRDAEAQAIRDQEAAQRRQIEAAERARADSMALALVHAEDAVKAASAAKADPAPDVRQTDEPAPAAIVKKVITVELDDMQPAPLPPPEEPATLSLGAIKDRMGFALPGAFIADVLGIPHDGTNGPALLYRESRFPEIKTALIYHLAGCL